MDLLKILFIFILLIAFPLEQIARLPIGDAAINLIDVGVFTLVIIRLFKMFKIRDLKNELVRPISVFALVLFFSLLANSGKLTFPQFLVSSLYLARWILYASIYLAVVNLPVAFKKNLYSLLKISGALIMSVGFILYFFYPDLRNLRYLGWDEHLYRNFSTFLDPNFAGEFFVLYFILIFDSLNIKKISSRTNFVNGTLLVLSIISILITFSRSAYISFAAAIIAIIILKKQIKFLAVILIFIFGIFVISDFTLRSEGTNLLREASGKARIDSIKNAITIFRDNPIFGVGFDSYRYAQRRYGFINEDKMLIHSAAGTDNSFLFILATSGIIGFSAFIYLIFRLLKFSFSFPLLFISIITLIVNSFFINSLFYPPFLLWMWVLLGLRKNKQSLRIDSETKFAGLRP